MHIIFQTSTELPPSSSRAPHSAHSAAQAVAQRAANVGGVLGPPRFDDTVTRRQQSDGGPETASLVDDVAHQVLAPGFRLLEAVLAVDANGAGGRIQGERLLAILAIGQRVSGWCD